MEKGTKIDKVSRILIVDDEESVRHLIGQMLERSDYDCTLAKDASESRQFLKEKKFELILCDINLPGESGLEFTRYALAEYPDTAAIMVTAMNDPLIAEEALEIGVYDYLIKPFDRNGVLISVANALRRRQLEIDNRNYRQTLEKMVEERTAELQNSVKKWQKALEGSIHAMALTVEMRDSYTAGHQQRVANLAIAIAKEMDLLKDQIDGIRMAGLIHDIGKISIPAEILSKPGIINEIEFSLIKMHSKVGYDILKNIEFPWPIAEIVLQHHERMDGSGYPLGLKDKEIILESKILGVADVVEAMASHRPYRPAMGIDKALELVIENKTTLFDPDVVDVCVKIFREKGFKLD